jgi:hypothetical protein
MVKTLEAAALYLYVILTNPYRYSILRKVEGTVSVCLSGKSIAFAPDV